MFLKYCIHSLFIIKLALQLKFHNFNLCLWLFLFCQILQVKVKSCHVTWLPGVTYLRKDGHKAREEMFLHLKIAPKQQKYTNIKIHKLKKKEKYLALCFSLSPLYLSLSLSISLYLSLSLYFSLYLFIHLSIYHSL